jgi:hypothetical protein
MTSHGVKGGALRSHDADGLLAKTEKRKDRANHDNKTDQIDDSIHEIPPVSVSDPRESNVLPNRKFRD